MLHQTTMDILYILNNSIFLNIINCYVFNKNNGGDNVNEDAPGENSCIGSWQEIFMRKIFKKS